MNATSNIMEDQEKEIFAKITLYNEIIKIKKDDINYKNTTIDNIMKKAWGEKKLVKNGSSLVKKYLKEQCDACEKGESMKYPQKCIGYKIINVCKISSEDQF